MKDIGANCDVCRQPFKENEEVELIFGGYVVITDGKNFLREVGPVIAMHCDCEPSDWRTKHEGTIQRRR